MEMKLMQQFQLQRPETDFEISPTIPPKEMARRVRLAFKQMPGAAALIVFAKVMTSDVPHEMKVAVWDAVRYSHIWWHVDEVLKGDVMENPIVQCAFADAVAMRSWRVQNRSQGWKDAYYTMSQAIRDIDVSQNELIPDGGRWLFLVLTQCRDERIAKELQKELRCIGCDFQDVNGNNLLWYLTYRDDQQAAGGFACPKTAKMLIDLGVDPNHLNKLGLSWNDVARHGNRPGARKIVRLDMAMTARGL